MTPYISNLLNRVRYEIENLQQKLAAGEPEGWEGTQRRMLLKHELEQAASTIITETCREAKCVYFQKPRALSCDCFNNPH